MKSFNIYVPLHNVIVRVTAVNKHIAYGYVKHNYGLTSHDKLKLIGTNL
jgi:hypothetical protein